MPLIDSGTLIVNKGNYFTAPVGTAVPIDLTAPEAEWDNIGHTDIESVIEFTSEGGETTTKGTLQNPNLRTQTSARSESFGVNLQQFTIEALKLYYGKNAEDIDGGKFLGVPTNPQATEVAFLAVFLDGETAFAIYAPKVSILRGDDPEIDDTENFASLPLQITPLNYQTNGWAYAVTPLTATEGS